MLPVCGALRCLGSEYSADVAGDGPRKTAPEFVMAVAFPRASICAVAATKMAQIGAPVAALALGCTPSTPHDQPAPLAALSKHSCEYESVNVV